MGGVVGRLPGEAQLSVPSLSRNDVKDFDVAVGNLLGRFRNFCSSSISTDPPRSPWDIVVVAVDYDL